MIRVVKVQLGLAICEDKTVTKGSLTGKGTVAVTSGTYVGTVTGAITIPAGKSVTVKSTSTPAKPLVITAGKGSLVGVGNMTAAAGDTLTGSAIGNATCQATELVAAALGATPVLAAG